MTERERMLKASDNCPVCHARVLRGELRTGQTVDLEPYYEVYERIPERDETSQHLIKPLEVASNNFGYARHICLLMLPRHVALLAENERLKGEIKRMTARKEAARTVPECE